jgi:uncharacterized protein YndB with AHSA1/START domain
MYKHFALGRVFLLLWDNKTMQEMQFRVEIKASREMVWDTLWQDETFRQWAGIIDPGTHLVGELKEGNEVQFISGNGYGVTSLVEKLTTNEFLLLRHRADTQDTRNRERAQEWTGGTESYSLAEKDGATTLTVSFDVPSEMKEYFEVNYPKALERVKALAERKRGQLRLTA